MILANIWGLIFKISWHVAPNHGRTSFVTNPQRPSFFKIPASAPGTFYRAFPNDYLLWFRSRKRLYRLLELFRQRSATKTQKESITTQICKSKMAEPELRRASDPKFVRKIYFGVKKTCEQKQCPTLERIIRALSIDKSQISRSRVEMQLNNAVRDGIIIESNSQGNRGKSVGEMKNSYRIPTLDNFYEVSKAYDVVNLTRKSPFNIKFGLNLLEGSVIL